MDAIWSRGLSDKSINDDIIDDIRDIQQVLQWDIQTVVDICDETRIIFILKQRYCVFLIQKVMDKQTVQDCLITAGFTCYH